jgi:hypothetical protein
MRTVHLAEVVGVDSDERTSRLLKGVDSVFGLRPIDVGTSTGLRVGQGSLAIGSPFGFDQFVCSVYLLYTDRKSLFATSRDKDGRTSVISGIGREARSPSGRKISNVVQTNATIHPPENSGYPLLDGSGRMILMATVIYSPSGASAGGGFRHALRHRGTRRRDANKERTDRMASVGRVDTRFEAGSTGVRDTQGHACIGGGQARDAGGPCPDLGDFDAPRAVSSRSGTQ